MKSYAQRMKKPQISKLQQSTAATAQISNQAMLGMLNEPDGDTRFSEALRAKFESNTMPQSERSCPMALAPDVLQKAEERYQTPLTGLKAYEDTGLLDSGYNGYAQGNEIHIDSSLAPAKREEVLMHEIGHVVQRGSGKAQGSGLLNNPALEQQADQGFAAPQSFTMPISSTGPMMGTPKDGDDTEKQQEIPPTPPTAPQIQRVIKSTKGSQKPTQKKMEETELSSLRAAAGQYLGAGYLPIQVAASRVFAKEHIATPEQIWREETEPRRQAMQDTHFYTLFSLMDGWDKLERPEQSMSHLSRGDDGPGLEKILKRNGIDNVDALVGKKIVFDRFVSTSSDLSNTSYGNKSVRWEIENTNNRFQEYGRRLGTLYQTEGVEVTFPPGIEFVIVSVTQKKVESKDRVEIKVKISDDSQSSIKAFLDQKDSLKEWLDSL